jgi:hypothetical protein
MTAPAPPPRDLPSDLADLRPVGAMRMSDGWSWAWDGKAWVQCMPVEEEQ